MVVTGLLIGLSKPSRLFRSSGSHKLKVGTVRADPLQGKMYRDAYSSRNHAGEVFQVATINNGRGTLQLRFRIFRTCRKVVSKMRSDQDSYPDTKLMYIRLQRSIALSSSTWISTAVRPDKAATLPFTTLQAKKPNHLLIQFPQSSIQLLLSPLEP